MAGIGVVLNPHAGGNHRADERSQRLQAALGEQGVVRETASFDALNDVLEELRDRRIHVLAICGGDGSFFRALSQVMRVYGEDPLPAFLPLRAGSMNTVARGLGLPAHSPEHALRAVAAAQRRGESIEAFPRNLIRVNQRWVGFMSGAAVVVRFLEEYYAGRTGAAGAAVTLGGLAASVLGRGKRAARVLDPVVARVLSDGVALPGESYTVLYASTIADIGLGFRPTHRAGESDEHFHVLAGAPAARALLLSLARIFRGRPTGIPTLHDGLARRVVIDFERPQPIMVDGDLLDPVERLEWEAGPVIRICRPRS